MLTAQLLCLEDVNHAYLQEGVLGLTVSPITFGSQVIWQYKMDLFPVAVRGSRNYFVWQNCGGVRVQVLEFLQHSVCTGTLYCVLIARTQGADLIQRGGIALRTATAAAAKAAAGALWQPGGRAGPGTLPT